MERSNLKINIFAVCLLVGWSLIPLWSQQNTPNPDTWMANGRVNAILSTGNVTYIGGEFNYVGKPCGHGLPIDISTGAIKPNFSKVDGNIFNAVSDGNGGCYIGGRFSNVGGLLRNSLAHILPDGTVDPNWSCSISGYVYALVRNENTLFIGGNFNYIKGQARNNIGALDLTSGEVTPWNPNSNYSVYDICVKEDIVYAGGDFTNIGGQKRSWVAAINKNTGLATDWNPHPDYCVRSIVVNGNNVYLGGWFRVCGGKNRAGLAAVDAITGEILPFNLNFKSSVQKLVLIGSTLYVGGNFTIIGGVSRNRLAAVDLVTSQITGWDPNVNGIVLNIAASGSTIYIGGGFTNVGGEDYNNIAALDAVTGKPIPMKINVEGAVDALAVSGNLLYAGGRFYLYDGKIRLNVAALDNTTGLFTDWNPNVSGDPYWTIYTLALNGTTLYVGGLFHSFGGQPRHHIAAVDTQTGQVSTWNPDPDSPVISIAARGDMVYVGGGFNQIGGQARKYLAAIDRITGQAAGWNPSPNGYVGSIALSDSKIYVGGNFTVIGGNSRNHIAAFDLQDGYFSRWNPGTDQPVYTLDVSRNKIYIGGEFHYIGGQQRNHVAAVDGNTGLVSGWNPSPNQPVSCVLGHSDIIYMGGNFTQVAGQTRKYIAAVDGVTGQPTSFNPRFNSVTQALSLNGTTLFVGGEFTKAGPRHDCLNFARFDNVPPAYLISGTVSDGTNPINGAKITFSHNNDTATTESNGNYAYLVSRGTTTTITPNYSGCKGWVPSSRTLTNITSNQNNQNFKGISIPFVLTSPNGGENWGSGTVKNITWLSSGFSGNLDFFLLRDNKSMGYIAQGVPNEAGSYKWEVGKYSGGIASMGSAYKVMVSVQNNPSTNILDTSDNNFTIGTPPLNLLSPNGGESWALGTVQNITWTSSGLSGTVRILLFIDGVKLGNIAIKIPMEAESYSWTVGNYSGGTAPAGAGYTIKIRNEDDLYSDTSNSTFDIISTPGIYVDHRCLDINRIPMEWIEEARCKVRLYLSGGILPDEIVKGLQIISQQDPRWSIRRNSNEFMGQPAKEPVVFSDPWLINEPLIRLEDILREPGLISQLRDTVENYNLEFLMLMWNRETDEQKPLISDNYLQYVSRWKNEFNPNVKMIYSTISGTKGSPGRELDNDKIRKYCLEKGNVLFDTADIESWYKKDEFREEGCQALHPMYTQDEKGIRERCVNKARAFWWLAARLAGWPGDDKY